MPPYTSSSKHQRKPEKFIAARLDEYRTRVWREFARNQAGERLPAVVSVVLAQGKNRWRAPPNLAALLDVWPKDQKLLARIVSDFWYLLYDLAAVSDEELQKAPMVAHVRIALWLMKNAGCDASIRAALPDWVEVFAELLEKETGKEAYRTLLFYLFKTTNRFTRQEFDQIVGAVAKYKLPKVEEVSMMTVKEFYLKDLAKEFLKKECSTARKIGRAEGRTEGRAEGRAEALLLMLKALRMPVSKEHRERILACRDLKVIDRWVHRIATAKSTADVLAD